MGGHSWPTGTYGGYERQKQKLLWGGVAAKLGGFTLKIYYLENAQKVSPDVEWPRYARVVAFFENFLMIR
jgi:hypothetical protein